MIRWLLGSEATRVFAHGKVMSPAKPDLGPINMAEALEWGEQPNLSDSPVTRIATANDFGSIAFELSNGAVAMMIASQAFFLRKGLAPDLELHGVDASLAVDRVNGRLTLTRANGDVEVVDSPSDNGWGNRFARHVFPGMAAMIAGKTCSHPNLEDGYRAQLFTDAAAQSAREGVWIQLSAIDPETSSTREPFDWA